MLTGVRAFAGEDVAETLAAVIRAEPDWSALPGDVPAPIVLVIQRCLERNVSKRLSDISAVRFVLDTPALSSPVTATAASARVGRWRSRVGLVAAAVVASLVTAVAVMTLAPRNAVYPGPVSHFSIALPEDQAFGNGGARVVAISPDGTRLAYTARRQVYVRTMADGATRPVAGADPANLPQPPTDYLTLPTFSPDGESIAFATISRGDTGPGEWIGRATIGRVRLDGSAPVTLARDVTFPLGMSWSSGQIVFGQFSRGVMQVAAEGGTPEVVVRIEEPETALNPQLLPDGRAVLFTMARGFNPATLRSLLLQVTRAGNESPARDIWAKARVVVQSLDTGARTVLVDGASDAQYLPTGHILYAVEGVLFARPFDVKRLAWTGPAARVVDGVGRARLSAIDMGAAQLATSDTGTLVYLAGPSTIEAALDRDLAIVEKDGVARLRLPPMWYEHPRVAPHGNSVAYVSEDGRSANIWIYDLAGAGSPRQLTFAGNNRYPIWSPDGRRITFQSDRGGAPALFQQPVDGTGIAERLTTADRDTAHVPYSWSPDGASLLFDVQTRSGFSLWRFDARTKASEPFGDIHSATTNAAATFSPDGKWVAYQSGEVPNPRIFVRPFPLTDSFWMLPQTARHARWNLDGSRLFFTSGPSLMAVDVARTPVFRFLKSTNVLVQQAGMTFGPMYTNHDMLPNGAVLAPVVAEGLTPTATTGIRQIEVVVNWFQDLTNRVPVR
jgi:serine/threonine-protein kinase